MLVIKISVKTILRTFHSITKGTIADFALMAWQDERVLIYNIEGGRQQIEYPRARHLLIGEVTKKRKAAGDAKYPTCLLAGKRERHRQWISDNGQVSYHHSAKCTITK